MICGDTVLVFNVSELCKLHITILEAKNLPAADSNGLSDPYVEIRAEQGLFVRDNQIRTSVKNETLNPKWNQSFDVSWNHMFRKLVLRVYDRDKWSKDDFLGKARISYHDLCDQAEHDMWLPLVKTRKNKENMGEIHVKYKATAKIPIVIPPNAHHLEFTRKDKDQDILLAFGWALRAANPTISISGNSGENSARGSLVGLDYRYKTMCRFSAENDGGLGTCIKYIADNLADDEEVGSCENYLIQLQKLSLDVKYLVACVHIANGSKSFSCVKGAFVRITKDLNKKNSRTLAFNRAKGDGPHQGCILAVIKRSYNGQWVFTAASQPLTGASAEESASQISAWAKENITP
eukprot:Phypoly_transcript_03586.p1 GENE.Phypoly_transcript_03586~~Phypoly_transcript_03586.p1  ORF type:complete len:349 (-),score=40.12 Phypoly_transcript_03586:75-1121(-)